MPLCRKTSAVALGSNLGDSFALLSAAAQALQHLALPASFRCSPLFRTAPVGGPADQPDFINAVLLLDWQESPEQLLQQLQQLEAAAGRQRLIVNGPRSLDLDLLWCGNERRESVALQLPHPRLAQRRFVLEPLMAIDPTLVPPGQALRVGSLLKKLIAVGVEPQPTILQPPLNWPGIKIC